MATWGQSTALASSNVVNSCRAMGGTFSPSGQELASISMRLSGTGNVRLAVYQGGSLSTGPAGATLIWDGGTVAVSGLNWYTATGASSALTAGAVTWVAWKANDSTASWYFSSSSADAGDFQTANGRWNSVAVSNDETIAWPTTWPSDAGSFGAFWYSIYLTHQAASGTSIPVIMNHLRNQGIS